MKTKDAKIKIEEMFRKQVQKAPKVKNAYLLVHSDKLGLSLNIAEGSTGELTAHPEQPNYMASVGKIFTSTLIGILYEKGKLNFEDKIADYLNDDLMHNLHVYKDKDYSNEIKIKHLLKQTSGLNDYFWPLLEKVLADKEFKISTREAIEWGKENLSPHCPPGKKINYTDTNYHLLGFIIENITQKPFHEVLKEHIFVPLNMQQSSVLHVSEPIEEYKYPIAHFSIDDKIVNEYKNYIELDYAGGGVVATNQDLLKFMQALVMGNIISKDTLEIMKTDVDKLFMGINYGYGIWKLKTVPIIMPKKYNAWGCVGATGAFMFYHPDTDSYLIGNFNDVSFKTKGIRFMIKVIKQLVKLDNN